ncbi:hypothetical protein BP6252_01826 [Coleophoma cylindrospora]|uniref:Nephrocystin 3-like N-terminal domain-containing protein n=1 Tax=Coleophoma cylindrospora TaxID=1849047 RepID=A0A3D8SD18_9HELO|nr:hypothetical protein BP6252_01826 [Coleophoma cylindrospora]
MATWPQPLGLARRLSSAFAFCFLLFLYVGGVKVTNIMAEWEKNTPVAYITKFIEKKGPSIHDAFIVETNFNELKLRYEAKDKHQEFAEALEKYTKVEGHNLEFDPAKCTWEEVVGELNKAHDAVYTYESREKKTHRKALKMINNASKIIEPAITSLPNELCILQGGLAIVFNLVRRRENNSQQILDVFGHLPEIISRASSKAKDFPNDKKLHHLLDELKVTLFDAIPNLIDALRPKTFLAKLTNPFRGFKVEELLPCIQQSAMRLEAHARDLRESLIVEIYHDTEVIRKTSNAVQLRIGEIQKSVSAVGQDFRDMYAQYEQHEERMDSRVDDLKEFCAKQIRYALGSQNGLFQMLKDVVSIFQSGEQEPELNKTHPLSPSLRESSPDLSFTLLQILDVYGAQKDLDLSIILRQSQEFDIACKTLLAIVLNNILFQRWITMVEADLMFVQGQIDSSSLGRTSPLSYICANLVRLLREQPNTITVYFFCGQHVASNDSANGPRGLIRSILAQLLEAWPHVPSHNIDLVGLDSHESISMDDLCGILEHALGQFPTHGTVCFIVDDLPKFERNHWIEDYFILLNMLDHLVQKERSGPRIKIMVTSPTRSHWLQELARGQIIELTDRERGVS